MRRFAFGRWGVGQAVLLAAGCELTQAEPNAINGSVWSKDDGGIDVIGPPANDGATFRSEGSGAFCDVITTAPAARTTARDLDPARSLAVHAKRCDGSGMRRRDDLRRGAAESISRHARIFVSIKRRALFT